MYDDANARHVGVGVIGVIYYLHSYRDTEIAELERLETRWQTGLLAIAVTEGGRHRVTPGTSSVLTPSSERVVAGEPVRPDTDRENLDGLVLNPPGRGSPAIRNTGD